MSFKSDIFITAAKRTPFGAFGGALKNFTAPQLGSHAGKAVIASLPSPTIVDSVVFGNVSQTTTDCSYISRHVGLNSGVSIEKPMLTVNRLCGSGFQAAVTAAQEIELKISDVVLAGGAESMSKAPYTLHGTRWGSPLGVNLPLVDSLWEGLTDLNAKCTMSMTAENLAEKYKITKETADEIAARSQKLWNEANKAGLFKEEITPMEVKTKLGMVKFDTDEHPRPTSTKETLAKLPALFKKGGTVSAGNASGISDGAAALIVASGAAVKQHSLKPLARIVAYASVGVPPEIMGIGPVPAIQKALPLAGLKLEDIDLIEINEAFASQFAACQVALGFDMNKANLQGGAVALGHPTGATGARILGHLAYELQRTGKRYALGAACIGGGQGICVILERA